MLLSSTTSSNPCPVCDNTKGDCRITDRDGVLCFGYADAKKGERFGDYICTKEQGSGHTATFAIDNRNSLSPEELAEYRAKSEYCKAQRVLQIETAIQNELPAIERDKGYRQLLSKLGLSESDRLHLINERSFTDEQIKALQFKSVAGIVDGKWDTLKVEGHYSTKLSGFVSFKEDSAILNAPNPGILLPVWQNGSIVALKIRLTNSDNGRYRWVRGKKDGGVSAHLYGELPLAVLPAPSGKSDGFWVTEGSELKPVILNVKHGVAVLGGGRYWHSSENHAAKFLPEFREKYGDRVILCPDAGDIHNTQILESWMKEAQFFDERGYDVEFAWWNQVNKTDCDIDELDNYSCITFLSVKEFRDLAELHVDGRKKAAIEAMEKKKWNEYITKQSFTADIEQDSQYFKFPANLPDSGYQLFVKSGMGTGKTEEQVHRILERSIGGNKALIIGYLNNLLNQTKERATKINVSSAHIRGDQKPDNCDLATLILLCWNSLYKAETQFGREIYIDEIISVLNHGIDGGTFTEKEQGKAYRMLVRALKSSSTSTFFDARLTDHIVKFVSSLDPSKKVIKVLNKTKVKPKQIKIVDAVVDGETLKKRDKSPLISMAAAEGEVVLITTDSRTLAECLDKIFSDLGRKGFALHSGTSDELWALEFTAKPDEFLQREKPQYIIISPSGGTGLSITLRDYFTIHLSFFYGVLSPAGLVQMTGRLRDPNVPHFIYCPERGIKSRVEKGHYSFSAWEKMVNDTFFLSTELVSEISDYEDKPVERMQHLLGRTTKNDPFFKFSLECLEMAGYENRNLRKCLVWMLEDEGHNVEIISDSPATEWNDKLGEAKEELQKIEAHAIFESQELELDEAKRLDKGRPNKETRRAIKKAILTQERVPGIENCECWSEDFVLKFVQDTQWIPSHQRYAQLQSFESASKKFEAEMLYKTAYEFSVISPTRPHNYHKIWFGNEMGVLEIATKLQNNELHKDSPEIVEFDKKYRDNKKLQTAWGCEPYKQRLDGSEKIAFLKAVLNFFGIPVKSTGKKISKDGVRLMHYQLDAEKFNDPMRLAIVEIRQKILDQWLLSDAPKKINWDAFFNIDQEADILSFKLQKATTSEEIELLENEWKSKKRVTWEGYETEEMYESNKKIEQILKQAWERLPQDELARLKALRTSEMPKTPMADVITYQAAKAQEVARQLDTKEGQRNQKRLEKQQQATNPVAFAANLCEKAEDAARAIRTFVATTHLGEFLHHIGGVLRREILDTDKFFHVQYRKMMKSQIDEFLNPELFLQIED